MPTQPPPGSGEVRQSPPWRWGPGTDRARVPGPQPPQPGILTGGAAHRVFAAGWRLALGKLAKRNRVPASAGTRRSAPWRPEKKPQRRARTRTAGGGGAQRDPGKDAPGGAGGAGARGGVAEPAESLAADGSAHPRARPRSPGTSAEKAEPNGLPGEREGCCEEGEAANGSPQVVAPAGEPLLSGSLLVSLSVFPNVLAPNSSEAQDWPTPSPAACFAGLHPRIKVPLGSSSSCPQKTLVFVFHCSKFRELS
ncbi:uncharacterized protein [Macaca fascicularis]|uniref:uncharacterized protein n=1 Tax=Macaca fascicularis TaxID=9541 RepID=UPI0032B0659F